MKKRILLLHGPNLNLLGVREPNIYGNLTLEQINSNLKNLARCSEAFLSIIQSNHEGVLIDSIHDSVKIGINYIIINAGGYTHTSVALRDALAAVSIPFIEVHLSNISNRELFRNHSYLSQIAIGVITGLGPYGYEAALRYILCK